MSKPDVQTKETQSEPAHRSRRLLVGALAIGLALVTLVIIFLRPTARLNRLLGSVGLTRLPPSAQNVRVAKRSGLFGAKTIYVRFEASAAEAARFVEDSPMTVGYEPTPLASISFGPRCSSWMTWDSSVNGRMYHGAPDNASVWLAIDDESNTIYVGVFEFRPPWLRKLLN